MESLGGTDGDRSIIISLIF
ncbi:uncharacterized protein G2W53_003155 [Senna tora]|uniref:Uncharacterized protein n=1 Tax=Senna tora TaxID=362788 RepID=A0A835CJ07_9FABA|nr:uncharacterized protein G2W53_003155 [Senna tora]